MTTSDLKKSIRAILDEELGSLAPSIPATVQERVELALDTYFHHLMALVDVRKGERQ